MLKDTLQKEISGAGDAGSTKDVEEKAKGLIKGLFGR